ncbi:serine hydrolase [Planococcus sp. CAU13]|uniref:serine hydrolase n=1 Tax=Planococcus sp. CAU13 TaxID=1541197 RepID=UPI00052FEDF3|nr:serine hydrolase [Planococcus sp. CAU13]
MSADELLKSRILTTLGEFTGRVSAVIETAGKRIDINGNARLKSASTIKLAVLLEAFRQVDREILKPHELIPLHPEDFTEGSGVLFRMNSVKMLSLEDLLTLMIIVSDNTASNVSIRTVGIENVNRMLEELRCSETVLGREFMDFRAAAEGADNWTSAADLVKMLKAVDLEGFVSPDSRKRVLHILKNQQLIANLHGRIDEDAEVEVYSKSGGLPGTVNDAGIFEYRGHKVYAAVLLDDSPDNHTGQEIIAEIGGHIYSWLKAQ